MTYAVYVYRERTPTKRKPSISSREIYGTKPQAQKRAKELRKWHGQHPPTIKGWGKAFVRVRPIKGKR